MANSNGKDNGDYLLGQKRDRVLAAIKRTLKWSSIPEADQRMLNEDVEQVVREIIREIIPVVASREFPSIEVNVSGLKEGKEGALEAKIVCSGTEENLLCLWHAERALLVIASASVFMGAKPAEVLPDQPDLMGAEEGDVIDGETGEVLNGNRPKGRRGKRIPPPEDHPM